MAEPMPPPEPQAQGGGGNMLTNKYLGLPGVVWIAGAALLAYFLFFRNKGGSSPSSSGGGGTSSTGDVTFTPPSDAGTAVLGTASAPVSDMSGGSSPDGSNNPGQGSVSGTPNPQPTPAAPARSAITASSTSIAAQPATQHRTYTVQKGDTLASIAKKFGITVLCLARANVYVQGEVPGNKKVGQPLGTGAGLKTGQVLTIPYNCP